MIFDCFPSNFQIQIYSNIDNFLSFIKTSEPFPFTMLIQNVVYVTPKFQTTQERVAIYGRSRKGFLVHFLFPPLPRCKRDRKFFIAELKRCPGELASSNFQPALIKFTTATAV